jgi:hypothetical protein
MALLDIIDSREKGGLGFGVGEMRKWGDGEMGKWGDGEVG